MVGVAVGGAKGESETEGVAAGKWDKGERERERVVLTLKTVVLACVPLKEGSLKGGRWEWLALVSVS